MYAFTFKRAGEQIVIPADNLHTATLLLPLHWRHGPFAGFSVTSAPITSDVEFYRTRCLHLEHQLSELLRSDHARANFREGRH